MAYRVFGLQGLANLLPGPSHDDEEDPENGNGVERHQKGHDDLARNVKRFAYPQNRDATTGSEAEQKNQDGPPCICLPQKVGRRTTSRRFRGSAFGLVIRHEFSKLTQLNLGRMRIRTCNRLWSGRDVPVQCFTVSPSDVEEWSIVAPKGNSLGRTNALIRPLLDHASPKGLGWSSECNGSGWIKHLLDLAIEFCPLIDGASVGYNTGLDGAFLHVSMTSCMGAFGRFELRKRSVPQASLSLRNGHLVPKGLVIMTTRQILITAALPYANGPIHLGHLVEYIQTDIWARFQRLRGHRCVFVCADDTHGTAIMISAQRQGITEQEWIDRVSQEHQDDFSGFGISFDHYGSTNSDENRELCGEFWTALQQADLVVTKEVEQLFDPEKEIFLADRFVKGTCPKCQSTDQYGDNCDKCGATYTPADLIDPVSTLSGATPVLRKSTHLFVRLENLHDFLNEWTQSGEHLQVEVANYLKGHFLHEPLRDWDVSRPAPYFGFEIPDHPGNYWYVWFDAPIGYIASTAQWCKQQGEDLNSWWKNPETEVHHFIGKDITYFHTLFWPGMLKTSGFNLPTKVHIHGFLTVNGEKMSKSKGTFIKASTYLKHLDPQYLRYFYASKLGPRLDDLDLNLEEFASKANADLVGKVVNLASRTAKFVQETGLSVNYPEDGGLFTKGAAAGDEIAAAYEACDYNRAVRLIIELADRANPFVEQAEPWKLRKDPDQAQRLQDVCTIALNLFRQIVVYLSPLLPKLAEQTSELLGTPIEHWDDAQSPLVGQNVNPFKHMLKRIEQKDIEAMVEESKSDNEGVVESDNSASPWTDSDQPLKDEPLTETCTIEDFAKVDLRVARVIAAEQVPEANKLLKLTLSLGGEERRQVFAGIKKAYEPDQLVGRLVVMVANLQPRKMRFGLSEGMITASGPGGPDVFLLAPDSGAQPGQRVH